MSSNQSKVRGLFRYSLNQSVEEIPSLAQDSFYIVFLENEWVSQLSITLKNNIPNLVANIGKHMFIEPTTMEQKDLIRKIFRIQGKEEPLMIICKNHPHKWIDGKNEGIKISFSSLNNEHSVIAILDFIVKNVNSIDFLKKIKWEDRVIFLKEQLKIFSLTDFIGLITSVI